MADQVAASTESRAFAAILSGVVTPFLTARGFRRSGQRYTAARGPNRVVIGFERRGDFFTCDLMTVNATLRAAGFMSPREHWRIRLGPIAVGWDKWWSSADDPAVVADDFLAALARGLDHIEPLATDDGIRARLRADETADPGSLVPIERAWLAALDRGAGERA